MKKLIRLLTLSAMAALVTVPALAALNATPLTPRQSVAQDDAEAKAALYKKVLDNYKTNQQVAYEAAKEYLQKYPNEENQQITDYLKNFVMKYEKGSRRVELGKLMEQKKWSEAFNIGKQVLADGTADDLSTLLNLSWAGFQMTIGGNNASNNEAANYAKQTIQLIEAGKVPVEGKPYTNKDEDLGWLNLSLGLYALKNNQQDAAASYIIKAVQPEGSTKQNPSVYAQLAGIYEGEYARLQQTYDTQFKGKDETPESKAALQQVKNFLEPMIDAYARAVAYAGEAPAFQAKKTEWKQRLTELYQFSKGSTDGLDTLIASVKTKPVPPQPTATIPAAPTTTTTDAPATGTDASGSMNSTPPTTTTTTPAPSTKKQTGTQGGPLSQPATTATPQPKKNGTPPKKR